MPRLISALISSLLVFSLFSLPPFVDKAYAADCSPTSGSFTGDGSIGENGVSYTFLSFLNVGICNWTVPDGVSDIDILVVAGGGGGGGGAFGGGGGAGGLLEQTNRPVVPGSVISIEVGAGGAGGIAALTGDNRGKNGGNSSLGSVVAIGGGGGGGYQNHADRPHGTGETDYSYGLSGGSSGGSSENNKNKSLSTQTDSDGATGFGFSGGAPLRGPDVSSLETTYLQAGGGGGGAGASGSDVAANAQAGNGGNGRTSTISGSSTTYSGGGGGGVNQGGTAGTGGTGGGGSGGSNSAGSDASSNTGGGGGGAGFVSVPLSGGNGGSGLVIIRYATVVAPEISSISHSSGPTKGRSEITITGTGLAGARVFFGENEATVSDDSATSLTVVNPAGSAGAVDVSVTTSGGTDTGADAFTYVPGIVNGDFEQAAVGSTIPGWTTTTTRVDLGVTSLAGHTTVDFFDYSSGNIKNQTLDDNAFGTFSSGSAVYVQSITDAVTPFGANAMRLSQRTSAADCHVIFGPAIESTNNFGANKDDVITLDWFAVRGSDDFAVLGYLIDTATGNRTSVVNTSGSEVSGWQRAQVTIPDTKGTYKFVFIHGTFDRTCGGVGGASFYIDNISAGESQTISFVSPAAGSEQNSDFRVVARASSRLPVTYGSSTPSVCTIDSETGDVERVDGGTCTITASQTGNDFYAAATQDSRTFTVRTGPSNTTLPSISGTKTNGETLTGSKGIWNESGLATTYVYQWQASSDAGSTWTNIDGADSTSFVLTSNEVGELIRFTVTATNNIASTTKSSNATSAIAAIAPSASTALSATAGNGRVTLSWTAGNDGGSAITDYVIEYSTDNSTWSTFADGTSALTSTAVTGLTNGILYYFRVKATNSVGTGLASTTASATPVAPATGGPAPVVTPTPTPTQTPRVRRTLQPRPIVAPTTPPTPQVIVVATPTPTPTQTPLAGAPTRPAELVRKTIEEVVEVLRPRIVDLNTLINPTNNPDPVASASASSAVSALPTAAALAQVSVPEEEKRVADIPSSVLKDGVPEESRVIVVQETKSQVVTGDGGLLTVEAKAEEEPVPVDSRGRVQMVRENTVEAEGKGLLGDSEFAVYLFSEPILLGVGKTDLAGRFFASFPVDEELPLGDHTLQVVGVTPTGEQRTIAMPVVVVEDKETAFTQALPQAILVDQNPVQAWFESVNYLLTLLLVLILVSVWVLYGTLRRRRNEKN